MISGRSYKALLAAIMVVMFLGVNVTQWSLTRERDTLNLNRYTELKGAPPVLMLTTVALGGFRGLISNALWMRATRLQEDDKFFEMVQLADWITKLEPHYPQVWAMQSWNMAFNISVKFSEPADRWRWVKRGIELLRDEGLVYNPYEHLLYFELAWFFEFKMGGNMDDAQMFYKIEWAREMSKVFKGDRPNWDEFIHPQTDDQRQRADLLRNTYKMDPELMKQVDDKYGPLEWRLPEAHAIYWATKGIETIKHKEGNIDPDDSIKLFRLIYQGMKLAVERGRLITIPSGGTQRIVDLGPNLAIIPKANAAYDEALRVEKEQYRGDIGTAQHNLLLESIFFLYTYGRRADAQRWYDYTVKKYPDKILLFGRGDSIPKNMTLDDYALGRFEEEIKDLSANKVKGALEGIVRQAYIALADDDEPRAETLQGMAEDLSKKYANKMANIEKGEERLGIPPLKQIQADVLRDLLSGELSPEETAILAAKTGQTNLPPAHVPPPK